MFDPSTHFASYLMYPSGDDGNANTGAGVDVVIGAASTGELDGDWVGIGTAAIGARLVVVTIGASVVVATASSTGEEVDS